MNFVLTCALMKNMYTMCHAYIQTNLDITILVNSSEIYVYVSIRKYFGMYVHITSTGWLIWYWFFLFEFFEYLQLGCKVFLWLKFIACNGHLIICKSKVVRFEYLTRRNENVPKYQTQFFFLISKSWKIELKNYFPYSNSKACK